jgi:hypothetical protein
MSTRLPSCFRCDRSIEAFATAMGMAHGPEPAKFQRGLSVGTFLRRHAGPHRDRAVARSRCGPSRGPRPEPPSSGALVAELALQACRLAAIDQRRIKNALARHPCRRPRDELGTGTLRPEGHAGRVDLLRSPGSAGNRLPQPHIPRPQVLLPCRLATIGSGSRSVSREIATTCSSANRVLARNSGKFPILVYIKSMTIFANPWRNGIGHVRGLRPTAKPAGGRTASSFGDETDGVR